MPQFNIPSLNLSSHDADAAAPSGPVSMPGALIGGVAAALLGAILWGVVGKITGGWEFKYGAFVIGVMSGVGVALMGKGQSKTLGIVAATFGLVGILAGKALFELLVQPELTLGQHIAYHTTVIDFIFYVATAAAAFGIAGTPAGAPVLDKVRNAVPFLR